MRPAAETTMSGLVSERSGSESEGEGCGGAVDADGADAAAGAGALAFLEGGADALLVGVALSRFDFDGICAEVGGDTVRGEVPRVLTAEWPGFGVELCGEGVEDARVGVGFDQDVVGESARVPGQRLNIGSGERVGRVLRHCSLDEGEHLEQHHQAGDDGQRCCREFLYAPAAFGSGARLRWRVTLTQILPSGQGQCGGEQDEEQGVGFVAAERDSLVEPRDSVARDVPPTVDARERQCENEHEPGEEYGSVPPRSKCARGDGNCRQGSETAGDARVRTEVVRPLGRVEHHEEDRSENDTDQAPGRAVGDAGDSLAAQQDEQRREQAQQHHEECEPSGDGTVDGLDEQVVVAQEVLVPRFVGADGCAYAGRFHDRGVGLVCEDDHEYEETCGGEWCEQGQCADLAVTTHDDARHGSGAGEQGGHTHQPGRCGGEGEGADQEGACGGK